jgi:hypothetical protein
MILRPYRVEDRDGCLALFDSNVPAFFAAHERADFASFLDEDLHELGLRYFVLVEGERIIACGGVGLRGEDAVMCWGIVDGRRHGEGLGRLLLFTRLVSGARLGARRAVLDTIPKVAPFFEKEGFVITGGEDDHYGPGIHRRDLARPLDAAFTTRLRAEVERLARDRVVFAPGALDDP